MITFDFTNRTAVVTGGTRGIGAAVSLRFLKAGASVIALYAGNDEAASAFKASCGELAGRLTLRKVNVADFSQCEAFFNELTAPVDILVNSAGIRRDAIAAMMSENDWQAVIDTNLTGVFNMTKLAVLNMMHRRYGRIIQITSPSGRIGIEGQANYAASKAGIVALTKSVAKEVARRKITVNAVSPGFIETELIATLPPELLEKYRNEVPLRRFGKPDEVADAILFLASEEAAYLTGTVLEVAGGI